MTDILQPKISVIVPCYKVEAYLDRCLESILGQTLRDVEVILVDDCSPDRVPRMCDEWVRKDNRIKVVHNRHNMGLGLTRNEGIKVATGEYVAFVDSDDRVALDMYEKLYAQAIGENADAVLCCFNFVSKEGKITQRYDVREKTVFSGREAVDAFLLDMVGPLPEEKRDVKYMMSACHAIYRREILLHNFVQFLSERQVVSEDMIFDLDFYPHAQCVVYIPDCLYYYYENAGSLTHTFPAAKYAKFKDFLEVVDNRLAALFPYDRYYLHADRLKLFYLRIALSHVAKSHSEELSVASIVRDPYWAALMDRYPFRDMDWKRRMFYLMIKGQHASLMNILLRFL